MSLRRGEAKPAAASSRRPNDALVAGLEAGLSTRATDATDATDGPKESGSPKESGAQVDEQLLQRMHSELLRIHSPCLSHLGRAAWALEYFLKQLATNLATVEDGRAAVDSPTEVARELKAFRGVWALLVDESFPEDTFKRVAKETARALDRFAKREAIGAEPRRGADG